MTICELCGHTTMMERRIFGAGKFCTVPGCTPCGPPKHLEHLIKKIQVKA